VFPTDRESTGERALLVGGKIRRPNLLRGLNLRHSDRVLPIASAGQEDEGGKWQYSHLYS
jgi:hypothetical protein